MKAFLKNNRQAPRKVRLVADAIRGKSVVQARRTLTFLPKKASPVMKKLLESAVANAKQRGYSADDLVVKTVQVDKGLAMRRARIFGRGRGGSFHRTNSHVSIELSPVSGARAVSSEAPAAKKSRVAKVAATAKTADKPAAKKPRAPRAKKAE